MLRFHPYAAHVRNGDMLANGKPKAGAPGLLPPNLLKFLKYLVKVLKGDAISDILDKSHHLPVIFPHPKGNYAVFRRELYGVAYEICEHSFHKTRIGRKSYGLFRLNHEFYVLAPAKRFHKLNNPLSEFVQVNG